MRLATMDSDDAVVLPPIPENVMDIARMKVLKSIGGTKRTAPHGGGEAAATDAHPQTEAAQTVSRGGNAAVRPTVAANAQKPTFFKDAHGNEYRMKGGQLYIKGWFDTNLKFRLLNASNGKELSLENKKIQIYGWHSVEEVTDKDEIKNEEAQKVDEIESVEEEAESDD